MKKLLIIEGDWNDGDYVTRISDITDKELKELTPIFNKMKKAKEPPGHNDYWKDKYPNLTEDELEILDEYVPNGYEQSCHTIVSITVYDIAKKKTYR